MEIGTGSGCIALTLAKQLPKASIIAVDISDKALRIARKNQAKLKIKNVKLLKSNLLEKVKSKPNIMVANLPYLTSNELKEVSISREPRLALYGGKNGLDTYRQLFQQIKERGWSSIAIFLEIGSSQAREIRKIASSLFPNAEVEIKKDLANRDRVVIIRT